MLSLTTCSFPLATLTLHPSTDLTQLVLSLPPSMYLPLHPSPTSIHLSLPPPSPPLHTPAAPPHLDPPASQPVSQPRPSTKPNEPRCKTLLAKIYAPKLAALLIVYALRPQPGSPTNGPDTNLNTNTQLFRSRPVIRLAGRVPTKLSLPRPLARSFASSRVVIPNTVQISSS